MKTNCEQECLDRQQDIDIISQTETTNETKNSDSNKENDEIESNKQTDVNLDCDDTPKENVETEPDDVKSDGTGNLESPTLFSKSHATREFKANISKIDAKFEIYKRNSGVISTALQQETEMHKILKLQNDRNAFELRKQRHKTTVTKESKRLEQLKYQTLQCQHRQNVKYCRQLISGITDLAFKNIWFCDIASAETVPQHVCFTMCNTE